MILFVRDDEAVIALRTTARQHKMGVERSEFAQHDLFLAQQPVPGVEGLQLVLLAGRHDVAVVDRLAQAAAHVNHVARAVGRSVGVEIAAIAQSLCNADALQRHQVGCHVALVYGEDAHVVGVAQFLVRFLKDPVVARRRLADHLGTVGDQQFGCWPSRAGQHVLREHEDFIARTLDDDIQIALDHHRCRFQRLAADRDRHHSRSNTCRQRHLHRRLSLLILDILRNLELERHIGIDQCDVELFQAAGQVHLAEIGLHVDLVGPHIHRVDVARRQLQLGNFIAAEDPFCHQRQALRRQPLNRLTRRVLHGSPIEFPVFLQSLRQLVQLVFQRGGHHELTAGGEVGTGVLGNQLAPVVDGFLPLLLLVVHFPVAEQDLRIAGIERIFGDELAEQLPRRSDLLRRPRFDRHVELGVDDLRLHVAPRFVGRVLRQILAPRGQRFGKLLLQLVTTAQQVTRGGDLQDVPDSGCLPAAA